MKDTLALLLAGGTLSRQQSRTAFDLVMTGAAAPGQIAALLTALAMRGETIPEIAGAAEAMRAHAVRIDPGPGPVVDTCGTGGDGSRTFNISTAAAIVAAGAGVKIAKHGNRSVTSLCGSADVLDALGVKIDATPAAVERCLRQARIGFLFAPALHGAMRHAGPVRKDLGFRTVFNLLGPLTNPAGADRQVIGAPRPEIADRLAETLAALGSRHAMVVCSDDGLDEIANTAPTGIRTVRGGAVDRSVFDPRRFGISLADKSALVVGSIAESAAAVREVLAGRRGPRRDIVLLNAAAAILVADAAPDWPAALAAAANAVDSGAAADVLERWAALSHQ